MNRLASHRETQLPEQEDALAKHENRTFFVRCYILFYQKVRSFYELSY